MQLGLPVLDGFPETIETTVNGGRVSIERKEGDRLLQLRHLPSPYA